jgi:hypothetical protein
MAARSRIDSLIDRLPAPAADDNGKENTPA